MAVPSGIADFFKDRQRTYIRFIRTMCYEQGLRDFFLTSANLRSDLRILDAGCGSGAVSLALLDALQVRQFSINSFHAFDITPAMLESFQAALQKRSINNLELAQADVLKMDELPLSWGNYDLIVSASMLEYVPRNQFADTLKKLRSLLKANSTFVLFISRRNPLTRVLIGRWWQANLYSAKELTSAFEDAGFSLFRFHCFPARAAHLSLWGYIVEARK